MLSNLQSVLDEFENGRKSATRNKGNDEGRGRSLTFGSLSELTFPCGIEQMTNEVVSTNEPNMVSSCDSIQESMNNDMETKEFVVSGGISTVSHTPPVVTGSYMQEEKRMRSGSISGRLRSASDLEDEGIIDKHHKEMLKDLIVFGDPQVLSALEKYENGDRTELQDLIRSGVLLGSRSQEIDLLSDLDLDFLTFSDVSADNPPSKDKEKYEENDDGIGDLDFTFGSDHAESLSTEDFHMPLQPQPIQPKLIRSASTGSITESRLRSNTFGSLSLEDMDNYLTSTNYSPHTQVLPDAPTPDIVLSSVQIPKRGRTKKKSKKNDKSIETDSQNETPSGLGLPRRFSDPNLHSRTDSHGLLHVERPDGWVGAYSPTSRKMRIERFLSKRNHRVWTKKVKYDVRKNFADSRLRVKGRFVKKEDEMLMRELLSVT